MWLSLASDRTHLESHDDLSILFTKGTARDRGETRGLGARDIDEAEAADIHKNGGDLFTPPPASAPADEGPPPPALTAGPEEDPSADVLGFLGALWDGAYWVGTQGNKVMGVPDVYLAIKEDNLLRLLPVPGSGFAIDAWQMYQAMQSRRTQLMEAGLYQDNEDTFIRRSYMPVRGSFDAVDEMLNGREHYGQPLNGAGYGRRVVHITVDAASIAAAFGLEAISQAPQ